LLTEDEDPPGYLNKHTSNVQVAKAKNENKRGGAEEDEEVAHSLSLTDVRLFESSWHQPAHVEQLL